MRLTSVTILLCVGTCWAQEPLSPREELATFKLPLGLKAELVASEPDVIDPVAMGFDSAGRLYVCEMIGYPNGGVATGDEKRGRIRILSDEDGDGTFEKARIFADGLRFPTGVMAWRKGIIVTAAPDVLYLEDTDGDGKADVRKVLYTGFGLSNIQQIINAPQFALDNWVYALVGSTGGTITCPGKPDMKPLVLRGRGIRFKPDAPGSIEPTSGGGQYGLASDDFQHWFVNTNSQHLRQIVLPDQYLKRNPYVAIPAVALDIPDHGAACRVHRLSPFEAWRVERTTRRKDGSDSKRFVPNELVPGGYITSGCSPVVYSARLFPADFRSCTFMCDPANNLIHRDKLEISGSVFSAKRVDSECEFLASTDNWFRPVSLTVGPDGALYICDFYRGAIETPLSLPEDIKAKMNLESRGRGRIWRIVPESFKANALPRFDTMKLPQLVEQLDSPVLSNRLTAQRLLIEMADKKALPLMEKQVRKAEGIVHTLAVQQALNATSDDLLIIAMQSNVPGIREVGLRMAESRFAESARLRAMALKLLDDPSPHVRLQLALSLGECPPDAAGPALATLLARPDADVWLQSAVLSSSVQSGPALLAKLVNEPKSSLELTGRVAEMIGARGDQAQIANVLTMLAKANGREVALLQGLGRGMRQSARPLTSLWIDPPAPLADAVAQAIKLFQQSAAKAADEKADLPARLSAVELLGHAPAKLTLDTLPKLLTPQTPIDLQRSAVRALASRNENEVSGLLLTAWAQAGPTLRGELLDALIARPDRVRGLLDAIDAKKVVAGQIGSTHVGLLKSHTNVEIRQRATSLFGNRGTEDRKKVVAQYKEALGLKPDPVVGKKLFAQHCVACHRLENIGNEVGADLQAALRNKTPEALLIDILDPCREVDTRFVSYRVTTVNGQTLTGILAAESPASITLRRAEKAEDTILRTQIDEIEATGKSLMPEEFEKQLTPQQLADLIAYLMSTR